MKWCIICLSVSIVLILLSCSDNSNGTLSLLTIETDKRNYFGDETIEMTITAHNYSKKEVHLIFPGFPYIGYVIDGEFSYFEDYATIIFPAVVTVPIEPFGKVSWTIAHYPEWYSLSPGRYSIRGIAGFPDVDYATYLVSDPVKINVISASTSDHTIDVPQEEK